MRLRALHLRGFKSFAAPTKILFDTGLTAIVGPNGCGKSNIVDAINWVLGTRSSKLVRGEEMRDVIFSGASTFAPSSFAEVSLVVTNDQRRVPINADEIEISRRLAESGDSVYKLLHIETPLKAIRNVLAGTGLGPGTSLVIEQGTIERLMLADAKELRAALDEASGIIRFKLRKTESEARLAKVGEDLQRLQDQIDQLASEQNSVRAHAGRARKFKELNDQFQSKVLLQLAARGSANRTEQARAEQDLTALKTQIRSLEQKLAQTELELSSARRKLEDLQEQVPQAQIAAAETVREREKLQSQRSALQTSISELKSRIASIQVLRSEAEKEVNALRREDATLEKQAASLSLGSTAKGRKGQRDQGKDPASLAESVAQTIDDIGEKVGRVRQGLADTTLDSKAAIKDLSVVERSITDALRQARDLRKGLSLSGHRESDQEISVTSPLPGEKLLQLEARRGEIRGLLSRLEKDISRLNTEQSDLQKKLDSAEKILAGLPRDIASAEKREEQSAEMAADLRNQKSNASELVKQCEDRCHKLREQIAPLQAKHQQLEIELARVRSTKEDLAQKAQENGVALDMLPALTEMPDLERLQGEIADLRTRIAGFGPVNELASRRLDEIEKQLADLEPKRDDLARARADLLEFIEQVTKECLKQFKNTLKRANEQLDKLFRRLFGGGSAQIDVITTEENEDPLTAPIEIRVKLPGKKVTKLHLLSGGEKSLTALAFVLALVMLREASVCVLDEVDAALDEHNAVRFAALLEEIKKETQIVVITHNKRTMLVADRLYGVAMSPPGVTTLLDARFLEEPQALETAISEQPRINSI